jgi:hypothetical protein
MISREGWKLDVDGLDLVLGVWLFVMPFMLGVTLPRNTVIALAALGLIAAADASWAFAKPNMRTPEWLMGLVGVVLFLSPWVLQFVAETAVAWNAWILGAIFAIDAVLGYVARPRT